jgi:hypothetical protein
MSEKALGGGSDMEMWKKYSDDPIGRIKVVSTVGSSKMRCLNCGRFLKGQFRLWDNDSGTQSCGCGFLNYFTLVGDFLWEVRIIKKLPEGQ